jgi:NhaA family Na+:H+ antiporter
VIKKTIKKFFDQEAATGILLTIATAIGLFAANSSWSNIYNEFLNIKLPLNFSVLDLSKDLSLQDWINDALMAIFFFLIGMELKKEILIGELSSPSRVALPAIAAIGGVIFPALIFCYFNWHLSDNLRGFAIPTATDIAFAYGIVCLFGKKIANSLKVFLVTLAVLDDLIAILIIAIFYTSDLKILYLSLALIPFGALILLNFYRCQKIIYYLLAGVILWFCILQSGIHATIAGVLCGLFIPLKNKNFSTKNHVHHHKSSVLEIATKKLSPIVNYLILPIFAFANSGVRINFSELNLLEPVFLGVACGLFFGKQFGVMLFSFMAIKSRICHLPRNSSWLEFYGIAIFTGIGFTMSLFISILAFADNHQIFNQIKIAVLAGSIASIIYGILITYLAENT